MDGLGEIVGEFLVESHESLDLLDRDLLALAEPGDHRSVLSRVFRTIHTVKGTCGFLGFGRLEGLAHAAEHLLSRLRDGAVAVDDAIIAGLLEAVDAIRALLRRIEDTGTDGDDAYPALVARLTTLASVSTGAALAGPPPSPPAPTPAPPAPTAAPVASAPPVPAPAAPAPASPAPASAAQAADRERAGVAESTIRVDVDVLDRLMNLVGELVLTRNQLNEHLGARLDPALAAASQRLDQVTGELQGSVMKARMQPIRHVWSRFPRVARDLAVECGKQVRVEIEGDDTELDRTVIEAIKDPMTHLVRNAVDHGIEPPDERVAAGKAAVGVLRLRARHDGDHVVIEVRDDGRGIDAERVRAKAVGGGIVTPERAAALSDHELRQLVFAPGLSTSPTVTNVSGRGVGMDVVKTNIEAIGGEIELASTPGGGTVVEIRIPVTLAILPALVVEVSGSRFALAQTDVVELLRLGSQVGRPIELAHDRPVFRLRGATVPLLWLAATLDIVPAPTDVRAAEALTVVVLGVRGRQVGVVVDQVVAAQEIVVKPLSPLLHCGRVFSGATILGDGAVALIVDAAALALRIGIGRGAEREASGRAGSEVDGRPADPAAATQLLVTTSLDGARRFAIPLADVARVEEIDVADIDRVAGGLVVRLRDAVVRLIDPATGGEPVLPAGLERITAVVSARLHGEVAAVVGSALDVVASPTVRRVDRNVVVGDRVADRIDLRLPSELSGVGA